MTRAGFLVAIVLAMGWPAFAQKADGQKLDPAYTGIWAVNQSCEYDTFVFASTFIERAGEDICYIDKVEPTGAGVRITASCHHEGLSVGQSTYDLIQKPGGHIAFAERPNETIRHCGPVPRELIDAYAPKDRS